MFLITLPGIGGSGDMHWQTHWERNGLVAARFQPPDWNSPDLHEWSDALERAVADSPEPPILVAHSLSCLLVAYWAQTTQRSVRAAFLVAVPNPAGPVFPSVAESFSTPPICPLPFPALVVASENDPYATVSFAREYAAAWGAGFVNIGTKGHVNGDSGLGEWQDGQNLLTAFSVGATHQTESPKDLRGNLPGFSSIG